MSVSVGGGGAAPTGVIGGGTGTTNQVAKFISTTLLDDSTITEAGDNIVAIKSGTTAQKFYVYGTTANTGEVAQIVALTSGSTVRIGSKQLGAGATARAFDFGYEQSDGTFLGWQVTTSGHLNAASTNLDIGPTSSPRSITLGSVGNGTGYMKMYGVTSGAITITVPANPVDQTLVLPGAAVADAFLKNNGSGVLSWGLPTGNTFAVGSSGTDFAVSTVGYAITHNLPDASATARGVVTTGTQTFAGTKTFSTPIAVASGGTGVASTTAYAVLCGGTTSTAALQSIASVGTSGQVLTSNGASNLPTFGTASVAGGGTGLTSTTAYAVLCGGTTSTAALQPIASVGTSGQVLTSNGAGALPTFQAAAGGISGLTTGTIPKAASATTLADSPWYLNTYVAQGDPANSLISDSALNIGTVSRALNDVVLNNQLRFNQGDAYAPMQVLRRSSLAQNSTHPEHGLEIGNGGDIGSAHFGIRQMDAPPATGNNYQLGDFTISAGRSQGTASPTKIRLRASAKGSETGTTQHTNVDRVYINCTKNLSDNTATTLVVFTLASGTRSGGIINYLVESSDGTDHQAECGSVVFSFVNKAASYTTGITAHDTQNSTSSGTLTVTWGITTGSSLVNVQVTADSSLTPTTHRITYTVQNLGQQDIAIQ
jgi:hypothetical protein